DLRTCPHWRPALLRFRHAPAAVGDRLVADGRLAERSSRPACLAGSRARDARDPSSPVTQAAGLTLLAAAFKSTNRQPQGTTCASSSTRTPLSPTGTTVMRISCAA